MQKENYKNCDNKGKFSNDSKCDGRFVPPNSLCFLQGTDRESLCSAKNGVHVC